MILNANLINSAVRAGIRTLPRPLRELAFSGVNHYCPLCQMQVRTFLPFGIVPRPNAWCPICGSLERHRLLWIFLERRTDLLDSSPKTLLHVAPEEAIEAKLKQADHLNYITADLDNPKTMVKMDITNIQYPDSSFGAILCSHVLEHVPNDSKAIHEFKRVLKPGGIAIIMVPITAGKTFEDPSIKDPVERLRLFGQHDHVRRYGPDVKERFEEARFYVRSFTAAGVVGQENLSRLGMLSGRGFSETVFVCEKRQPTP